MTALRTEANHIRVPRDGWPEGKWDSEPDFMQWVDSATDLDCMAIRATAGFWRGAVGVPFVPGADHGLFTEQIFELPQELHDAAWCMVTASHRRSRYYLTQSDRTDDLWWYTFDFGHAHDSRPGDLRENRYRTLLDAVRQCVDLADVLHRLAVRS